MPTPKKTSQVEILDAAAEMLESGGIRSVTMLGIAKRVGIKGASLYKHFPDAEAVLLALEERNFLELGQRFADGERSGEGLVRAYLAFTNERPEQSKLLFRKGAPELGYEAMRVPLEYLRELLGDAQEALVRLRVLTAFLHGYTSMVAAGAFRQGGDLDAVIAKGIGLILPEESQL